MAEALFSVDPLALRDICIQYLHGNQKEACDQLKTIGGMQSLEKKLKTNYSTGRVQQPKEQQIREKFYGDNTIESKPGKGFHQLIKQITQEPRLRYLQVFCAFHIVVNTGLADQDQRGYAWVEGFSIFCGIVLLAIALALIQYNSEKHFRRLNKIESQSRYSRVLRNGQLELIQFPDVRVGDIIVIDDGDELPADGFLIEIMQSDDTDLAVDESIITRESEVQFKKPFVPVEAQDQATFILLGGTRVLFGQGKVLIVATGEQQVSAYVDDMKQQIDDVQPSLLQKKIKSAAIDIGRVGLFMSVFILVAFYMRFIIHRIAENKWKHSQNWSDMIYFMIVSTSVLFISIPQGLILSMKFTLDYSMRRMLSNRILVKERQALQALGFVNILVIDQSSFIGDNRLTILSLWSHQKIIIPIDKDEYPEVKSQFSKEAVRFLEICLTCTHQAQIGETQLTGTGTELAFVDFAKKIGINVDLERIKYLYFAEYHYTPTRKMSAVILEYHKKRYYFAYGELLQDLPESITNIQQNDGIVVPLRENVKQSLREYLVEAHNLGEKVNYLAFKEISNQQDITSQLNSDFYQIETQNLVLIACLSLKSIITKEVKDTYQKCMEAGLEVKMATSGSQEVAQTVAQSVGLIDDETDVSIAGKQLQTQTGQLIELQNATKENDIQDLQIRTNIQKTHSITNKAQFERTAGNLKLVYQASPQDQFLLVTSLKSKKLVVSYVGDSVNEVPSIRGADIGFSLGMQTTESAKAAASIIILDDSFSTLFKSCMWARCAQASMRKYLQFQATMIFVIVFINFIGALILMQEIISPIQIMWSYFILDAIALLALNTESPYSELERHKPESFEQPFITQKMLQHIIGQVILQVTILSVILFAGDKFLPEESDEFDTRIMKDLRNSNMKNLWWTQYSDEGMKYVRSGRFVQTDKIAEDYSQIFDMFHVPSRHFTYIFNIFIMFQFFNFVNCRYINDEPFRFSHLCPKMNFLIAFFLLFFCQAFLVTYGQRAIHCYSYGGLTVKQWFVCIAFAATTLIWAMFLKCLPEDQCFDIYGKLKEVIPFSENNNASQSGKQERIYELDDVESKNEQVQLSEKDYNNKDPEALKLNS